MILIDRIYHVECCVLDEDGEYEAIGLIPKGRLYVHLSGDKETAVSVGKRHGKPVVYQVLSGKMAEDGYTFYLSKNGVWLTRRVPAEYLEKEQ